MSLFSVSDLFFSQHSPVISPVLIIQSLVPFFRNTMIMTTTTSTTNCTTTTSSTTTTAAIISIIIDKIK